MLGEGSVDGVQKKITILFEEMISRHEIVERSEPRDIGLQCDSEFEFHTVERMHLSADE
jgi:hypothetical protein